VLAAGELTLVTIFFTVDNVQGGVSELTGTGSTGQVNRSTCAGGDFLVTDPERYRLVFFKRK
jgi:hypothetical protein